ncbi:hypothetical protein [Microvirga terricola]|uniref:Uncharacterized protein n=1 Tax=Microvirga terricola TaxID=2719797 RepID=A0ABX0VDG8_9HYPH|nr:hypothetical protein [Microvirga terricola]NIX77000.1 hypothetical protein [Microvirga terricola]
MAQGVTFEAQLSRSSYKQYFLVSLIIATALPTFAFILNYHVFGQTFSPVAFFLSIILIMSGAHVWLTLAYYLDKHWLSFFATRPLIFFGGPAAIIAGTILLIAGTPLVIGATVMYAATFLNIWHHSKQNWGILAMVGKIRGSNIAALRVPVVWAWPFFMIPWAQFVPEVKAAIPGDILANSAMASGLAYLVFFAYYLVKSGVLAKRDPSILLFIAVIAAYFIPTAMFNSSYMLMAFPAAHALQYYIIVLASLALRERKKARTVGILSSIAIASALLIGLTVTAWLVVKVSAGGNVWAEGPVRIGLGVLYGVNLLHFYLDAFIWKFSDKQVREQHGEAFAF